MIATARDIESIRDHEKRGATILELDLTADEEVIKDFAQKAIAVQCVSHLIQSMENMCTVR